MDKHADKYRILGLNVAYYRGLKGLKQRELADMVFIDRNHLGRIESLKGVKSFSLDVVFDIADALDVDVAKLFEKRE